MRRTNLLLALSFVGAMMFQSVTYADSTAEDPVAAATSEWEYCGEYRCTYYCPCEKCCGKSDGITASGTHATQGRTVAASKEFPFGTKLMINGHEYIVEDRGVGRGKIDIFLEDHQECLNNGVLYADIYRKR